MICRSRLRSESTGVEATRRAAVFEDIVIQISMFTIHKWYLGRNVYVGSVTSEHVCVNSAQTVWCEVREV